MDIVTFVVFIDTKQMFAVKSNGLKNEAKEELTQVEILNHPTLEGLTLEDPTRAVKDHTKVEKVVVKAKVAPTQEAKAPTHLLHLINLKVERAKAKIKALVKDLKERVSPKEEKMEKAFIV